MPKDRAHEAMNHIMTNDASREFMAGFMGEFYFAAVDAVNERDYYRCEGSKVVAQVWTDHVLAWNREKGTRFIAAMHAGAEPKNRKKDDDDE
jgi:hypothetical protein